ncbi:MAG TPA: ABC transporter permease subunit [Anaerolineales bacterium]|nr:ABC transporter permease subunit [Anaerolineales bacterium]
MADLNNILLLAQKELRDAARNRWFLLYAAAFALLSLALSFLGVSGAGRSGLAGFGRTGASLINLVILVVPMMGLTVGALSLAGERERGSLLYLLAQPLTAFEILTGKFLGLALALLAALATGFGLSGLLIAYQGGTAEAGTYLTLVFLAFLLALASLSLGFLISALVKKSAAAVGVALFLWLALTFFGDLGLMGTAVVLKLQVGTLFGLALANPLQIFKIAAVLKISESLEILGPAGIYALRTYGNGLLPLLIGILAVWITLPGLVTNWVFSRRGGL